MPRYLAVNLYIIILMLTVKSANAYQSNYTPITKEDRRKPFPLEHIVCDKDVKGGQPFQCRGRIYLSKDDDFQISGRNKKNEDWQIVNHNFSETGHLAIDVSEADLDGNGEKDLIVFQDTSGCGLSPTSILVTVFFDKQSNPYVVKTSGYFEQCNSKHCIKDILRFKPNGHALLVTEDFAHTTVKGRDKRFWKTVLYEAQDYSWTLIPNYRGYKIPLLVQFTESPNHEIIAHSSPGMLKFDNIENGPAAQKRIVTATLLEFNTRHLEYGEDPNEKDHVIMRTSKDVFDVGDSGYLISSHGKRIASFDNKTSEGLLAEAAKKKQQIKYMKTTNLHTIPLYIWLD